MQCSTVSGRDVPCSSALADVVPSRARSCAVASDMAAMEEVAVAVAGAVWSRVGRRCSAGGSRVGYRCRRGCRCSKARVAQLLHADRAVWQSPDYVGLVGDVGVVVGGWRVQTSMYDVPRDAPAPSNLNPGAER